MVNYNSIVDSFPLSRNQTLLAIAVTLTFSTAYSMYTSIQNKRKAKLLVTDTPSKSPSTEVEKKELMTDESHGEIPDSDQEQIDELYSRISDKK